MRTRIQVAGVRSIEDARFLSDLGVDAIGLTVGLPPGAPDDLPTREAAAIAAVLPPFVTPVLITYRSTAEEVVTLLRAIGASTVQLHGDAPVEEVRRMREAIPGLRVIRRVTVAGPEAVEVAAATVDADALILDSYDPVTGRLGATGRTHDWSISAAIARTARVPVILAGGLRPENVAAAIRAVRPWAVDVHTGVEDAAGNLDRARAASFVEAVLSAVTSDSRSLEG